MEKKHLGMRGVWLKQENLEALTNLSAIKKFKKNEPARKSLLKQKLTTKAIESKHQPPWFDVAK